jgi:predicted TIM-barrel fold metal-dependent hydrolase
MNARPPRQQAPALSCDCHCHIFGPFDKYPMGEVAPTRGAPYEDVAANVKALAAAAPGSLRLGDRLAAPPGWNPAPEAGVLLDRFFDWVPDAGVCQKVLVDNPARLYGF